MHKVAKVILIAGGILALGVVAAMLSANLYIESKDSQARIERKLSRVLHCPVKITATSFSIFRGLQVKGVTIAQEGEFASNGNFFEATSFSADFEYWPLLSRQLRIHTINVLQPQLDWFQTTKGKWRAPSYAEPPPSAKAEGTPSTAPKTPIKPFEVSIDKMTVSDGTFRFFDHDKNPLLSFAEVNAEGHLVSPTEMNGKAESSKATIRDSINFQHIQATVNYANRVFALQPLHAKLAGGSFTGEFQMETADPATPFKLKAEFEQADVNQLLVDAGGTPGQVTGELSGSIDLAAKSHKLKDFTGSGKFTLTHGRVQQYDFFAMLGQVLQIEELSQLNLQAAELDYHFSDGKIFVDKLDLQSPNLKVSATGTIRMDGKMNLNARLAINPPIAKRLPGFVAENFHPLEGTDQQYIDFDVTGTVSKPHTNLLEIAVGKKIEKEVGGLLNSLFGKKRKDAKKPVLDQAPSTQPIPESPSPTPIPDSAPQTQQAPIPLPTPPASPSH